MSDMNKNQAQHMTPLKLRQASTGFHDDDKATKKPTVIGLYGLPGAGKSTMLNQLRDKLGSDNFAFYDGSQVIAELFSEGLPEFQKLDGVRKAARRAEAIRGLKMKHLEDGKTVIIAGHYMFWEDNSTEGLPVWTTEDAATYSFIIYMNISPVDIYDRCAKDVAKTRTEFSVGHLERWQCVERHDLRQACYDNSILFSVISSTDNALSRVCDLIVNFTTTDEITQMARVERELDEFLNQDGSVQATMALVLDADRTLTAQDTGRMFWEATSSKAQITNTNNPLKQLFKSKLGYSTAAFRQAGMLYEDACDTHDFDKLCAKIAAEVELYPDFVCLLQLAATQMHINVIVVTSGIGKVWEEVLHRYGLSAAIKVIGGGRYLSRLEITPEAKEKVVGHLKAKSRSVLAFGDDEIDLPMLNAADHAYIVVGEERIRSKAIDRPLRRAVAYEGRRAYQILQPRTVSARLRPNELPVLHMTANSFVDFLLEAADENIHVQLHDATSKNASKLLATPMRNAENAGPSLRRAHHTAGHYLAIEYLTSIIGVEHDLIQHVQGHATTGARLMHESQTLIVAAMRGGEPMAFGISSVFPLAPFLHAGRPEDIRYKHIKGMFTIVLVDSVINNGGTIVEFVKRITVLHACVRIIVVAGVAQARSIQRLNQEKKLIQRHRLTLVTLRVSENRYIERGGTDTGNRLFNTTGWD